MKKIKTVLLILVPLFVGLAVGAGVGYKFGLGLGDMYSIMYLMNIGEYAERQFNNADYQGAKVALEAQISGWEKLKGKGAWADDKMYSAETADAYARLAILEEREGREEEAEEYFRMAAEGFVTAGWSEMSSDKIREVVLAKKD